MSKPDSRKYQKLPETEQILFSKGTTLKLVTDPTSHQYHLNQERSTSQTQAVGSCVGAGLAASTAARAAKGCQKAPEDPEASTHSRAAFLSNAEADERTLQQQGKCFDSKES